MLAWKRGFCLILAGVWNRPVAAEDFKWIPTFQLQRDFEMKPFGGMQCWGDVAHHHGWRIQHNVFFKQHRLLDPNDHRHASGTLEDCKKKLEEIKKDKKLPQMSGHAVIMIHGIVRSSKSFNKLAEALKKDGFTVIGFDYPSTQVEITQSAEYLHQLLQSLEGVEKISFVVHSMGGLVVRSYLKDHEDKRIERMVMLAVPNQGANMADIMRNNLLFKLIFGPAGKQLGINGGFIDSLPTPEFEFGVIAGARGKESGYNPLIPGDDDGTVAVDSARLPGATDFATVESLHSFIMNNANTITFTRHFLQHGRFRAEGEKQPILHKDAEEKGKPEREKGSDGEGETVKMENRG
jgi:pimeloyl-ACP methyl ester carboxylesterase